MKPFSLVICIFVLFKALFAIVFTTIWLYPYQQLWPYSIFWYNCYKRYDHNIRAIVMANESIWKTIKNVGHQRNQHQKRIYLSKVMSFTSHGPKLWPFPLYLEPFENMASRGCTSHISSELIFMFLDSGWPREWGQLQS